MAVSPSLHVSRQPDFRQLLETFAEAVRHATSVDELHDALAELRRVEAQADSRRISLVRCELSSEPDEILDSAGAARLLNRTRDWVEHHRYELSPALSSPARARPRYSRRGLQTLMAKWSPNGRRNR
jgi:hypothetical protein